MNSVINLSIIIPDVDQDSSDGTATRYRLEDLGIESRWAREFPYPSRPSIEPPQSPIRWEPGLSLAGKATRR